MKKGSTHSAAARIKMRDAKIGKPSNWKGKSPSPETRLKMRLAKVGKIPSKELREKNRQGQYRRHAKNDPDYVPHTSLNKRRKILRQMSGRHSEGEWQTMKAQYDWTCPSCKKKEPDIKLTRDHIIPVSRGGSDNIENIQPLCHSCNCRKHTLTIRY